MRDGFAKGLTASLALTFCLLAGCSPDSPDGNIASNTDPRTFGPWEKKLTDMAAARNMPGTGTIQVAAVGVGMCSAHLTVLSYNIRGLPLFEGRDTEAFDEIGRILEKRQAEGTAPDVVILEEAYSDRLAEKVRSRAGYRYEITGTGDHNNIFLSNPSGLNILSNYKLSDVQSRPLGHSDIVESLANKSVLSAKVEIPGVPDAIGIVAAHPQAGSWPSMEDKIRKKQIGTIADFFSDHGLDGNSPSIFAGDFNFKPKHESYYTFLDTFPFYHDAGAYCLLNEGACAIVKDPYNKTNITDIWKTTNDRQFFSASEHASMTIRPVRFVRNFTQEFKGEPLSDHWGYEVEYQLSWPCQTDGIITQKGPSVP